MGLGIILEQYKPNKLRIIDSLMNWSQVHDYKITKQTVKGNTMALKLTTKGVKGNGKGFVKGKGTIRLIRTGKNSYMIPKIYQLKSNETRINRKIVKSAVNMDKAEKPKAKAIKGFRTATIKSLKSRNNLMHYGMSLSAYK
ncbi:hypothetical protein D1831_12200 [Lactiplantibacillus garii]|uniref:Uncharacterized protein n=2 Tax=Lactiplantibacillus garii TaxID=2306423 RepID=A0A426D4P3_9LACO|nr:hypothetical protein D1831_12200 [Lactiplantibacillus garii]